MTCVTAESLHPQQGGLGVAMPAGFRSPKRLENGSLMPKPPTNDSVNLVPANERGTEDPGGQDKVWRYLSAFRLAPAMTGWADEQTVDLETY